MKRTQILNRTPAVILGASRNGLGAVRSLWREGVPCTLVARSEHDVALRSRCASRKLIAGGPHFEQSILEALDQVGDDFPVLIPTADIYLDFMLHNRDNLAERFRFCIPASDTAETLLDKSRELQCIQAAGISIPTSVLDLTTVSQERFDELTFPVIIKPKTASQQHHLGQKNVVVRSLTELRSFLRDRGDILATLLLQEFVPGDDTDLWVCNCTFDRLHQLIGAFTFRRLGTAPAHRGSTTYAFSERNEDVINLVRTLGMALGYVGPAMMEFKWDARIEDYVYIELNPRIGMCNYFDTCCGVNNVFLTYCLAKGDCPSKAQYTPQDENVIHLALFSDLNARIEDGERVMAIMSRYLRNIHRRHVGAFFAWSDPRPGWASLASFLSHISSHVLKKVGRRMRQIC